MTSMLNNKSEIYKMVNNKERKYLLHTACENGNIDDVVNLIEVHKCNPYLDNNAALINACKNGHLDIVKYLIEVHNCDPCHNKILINILDEFVKSNKHTDIVKYFVNYFKDVQNYTTPFSETVIDRGEFDKSMGVFKELFGHIIEASLKPNMVQNINATTKWVDQCNKTGML